MQNDIRDLRHTIIPKSDQLNADQLLGGPMTITVTDVRLGSGDEQPVIIHYEGENGRPYKPCKSMRRVLVFAWGANGADWIGRSMTLYNQLDVKFGGQEVGGIRISHLSHIERDIDLSLTTTRGKKAKNTIRRLVIEDKNAAARELLKKAASEGTDSLKKAWAALTPAQKAAIGPNGCPADLKETAAKADSAASPPTSDAPVGAFAEILASVQAAADIDALNDAYDLVRTLEPAPSQAEREELARVYEARAAELQA